MPFHSELFGHFTPNFSDYSVFQAANRHYIDPILSSIGKFSTCQNHQERRRRTFRPVNVGCQFFKVFRTFLYLPTTQFHLYRSPPTIVKGNNHVSLEVVIIMIMPNRTSQVF